MSTGRYRFGDLTHRGPLGAVRPGQVALGLAGAIWAIACLDLSPSGTGLLAGVSGLLIALASATMPVGGRTVEQWLPVVCGWLTSLASGRVRSTCQPPAATVTLPASESSLRHVRDGSAAAPPQLGKVRIVGVEYRGGLVGAVSERRGRRLTAVLVARAPGFALADRDEQEQRLAVWASVLQAAAHGAVRRIAWVQRTAPAQGDGLARWLYDQRDPDIDLASDRIARSYLELMAHSAQAIQHHEVLISVQVDTARLRHDHPGELHRALISACERVASGLERARVRTDRALTPGGLARALRVGYDPYAHAHLAALRAAGHGDELAERSAWPAAAGESWGSYQVDAAVHATFEIAGWPRSDVGPAFLSPLLTGGTHVRSVAVCFEPLDPRRSLTQAEADVTRSETDRHQRHRLGQIETARHRHAQDATQRRESELAAGHTEVRLAGYITVTGTDPDELEEACEETITLAARSHLELRRLYGQQAHAFTFTLPLCRGMR